MLADLRQAVRHVAGAPWLTAVIVVSLALGTGANAAVYSAIDALLFRPPAGVADAGRLVDVYTSQLNGGTYGSTSFPDLQSLSAAPSLQAIAAIEARADQNVHVGDRTAAARVAAVTPSFWAVLGTSIDGNGVVISDDLWRSLGADPAIVGKGVAIGPVAYRVAAIAPKGFRGLHLNALTDAWLPLEAFGADRPRGDRRFHVVGRLRNGATVETLQRELASIAARLAAEHPETNKGTVHDEEADRRLTAVPYARLDPSSRSRASLFAAALFAATVLLLLSACVNAGSLLLSRGLARRTELTVKTALGAERRRLVREVVVEGVLMALAGTAAGLIAARWTAGAIPALFAPEHASLLDTRVERPVMLVTLAVGLVAGLVFSLVPALASTRGLSAVTLRADAGGVERYGGARLRMLLVAAQLALSTIFLVGSALLARMVDTSLGVDRSAAGGETVFAAIETYDPEYRDAALPRLRGIPSVARVGWVTTPPLGRPNRRAYLLQRGQVSEVIDVDVNFASAEYFTIMHALLIEGRFPRPDDERSGREVAVVNEAFAQQYFAGRPVGRAIADASGGAVVEVLGVVQTRSYRAFEGPQRPMIFFPMWRAQSRGFYAVVGSHSYETNVDRDVRTVLAQAGGTTHLEVVEFNAFMRRALAPDRLIGTLVALCGALALGLAVVGVYGVMVDAVRRRRREFGLRTALGARPVHIAGALARSSLAPAFGGIFAGIGGAIALGRIARSLVFGVPPIDLVLAGATATLLVAVVLAALAVPVRLALRVSPLVALRD
jgi:predicted permease